jgi:preprotein translocase subunit SecG
MLEILMNSQNEHGSAETAGINNAMSRHMATMVIIFLFIIIVPVSGIPKYRIME